MNEKDLKNYECYITYACNRKCKFCFAFSTRIRTDKKTIPYSEIVKNLYLMSLNGYKNLSLLGGEPTIHKDIIAIVKLAKITGYKRITLFTNGIKLADENFAGSLKKSGLNGIVFNLPHYKKRSLNI